MWAHYNCLLIIASQHIPSFAAVGSGASVKRRKLQLTAGE